MATILTSQYGVRGDTVFIVFDIEAVGDVNTPDKCRMWNLAACVLGNPEDSIDLYIQPALEHFPKATDNDFCNITVDELETLGATTIQVCIQKFMSWLNQKKENPDTMIILCSHGCFRYDKILFEYEFMRNGLHFQPNIYFFDTLHWTRQTIRGRGSYALSNIYEDMFKEPIKNPHMAYSDALALDHVISALTNTGHMLSGVMYPPFFTPIVRMPGIGVCSERILVNKNIQCVEELYVMYKEVFGSNRGAFVGHMCHLGLPLDSSRCVLQYVEKNFNV